MTTMSKDVEHYLSLPYKLEVVPLGEEDGGGFYARYFDFGTSAHGDGATPGEAAENARVGLRAVLEVMIEHGDPIPEPLAGREYSGKFNVRVPKSLHRALIEEAENEGVSLNMLIVNRLSRTVRR
jgi:predicted RNase H-like HicB family nuclease